MLTIRQQQFYFITTVENFNFFINHPFPIFIKNIVELERKQRNIGTFTSD